LIVVPRPLPAAPLGVRRKYLITAGEKQLGSCAAARSKYCRLHLHSGKVTLAAMYLRRVRVAGRTFAAALTHVSTIVTPLAPAAQNLGVGLRRPCQGHACGRRRRIGRCVAEKSKYYRLYLYSGRLTLAAICLLRVRVVGRIYEAALTHVYKAVSLPAPAAQDVGVGLRRPCRGQACSGVLGAMARISATITSFGRFINYLSTLIIPIVTQQAVTSHKF
jgi:hypothetical protein